MTDSPTLGRTLETLSSPSSAGSPDAWPDAVNCRLRQWIGCDAVFFRVSDGSPTRVNPLSAEILAARDGYRAGGFRSQDPWAVARVGRDGALVGTFEDLLGPTRFRMSGYYRNFLRPHGIHDYVGAQIGCGDAGPVTVASFNLGSPRGSDYVDQAIQRLRAVVPALRAGLPAWLTVRSGFADRGAMVDEVPVPLLLCDHAGRTIHANSALGRLLATEPETERLRAGLASVARLTARSLKARAHDLLPFAGEHALRTAAAVYRVRPVEGAGLVRGERVDGIVLAVEPGAARHRAAVPAAGAWAAAPA